MTAIFVGILSEEKMVLTQLVLRAQMCETSGFVKKLLYLISRNEDVGWEIIEPLFLQALTLEDGEPNFDAAADNSPNENESHYNTGNGSTSIGGDQDGKIPMCYVELLPFFFYFLSLFWSTFCYVLCAR